MEISLKNENIFPSNIRELLKAFYLVGFFDESVLIGSWVMPLYQEAFGINYVLRTMDIDFAVKFVLSDRDEKVDLEKVLTDLGYLPVVMQSGIRRFTSENFTVEFVAHRKGGSVDQVISIKKWNITASPLPFVDLLLSFPFTADFGNFKLRAPLPEAFFVHKLVTAQRRRGESKKDKNLDQCTAIARQIDANRLNSVIRSLKLSKKAQKAMRASCEAIGFPPQQLGIK
ncbi:MAG: hypothetical protein FJ242_10785 [Nitrospira sp.]|nr:hypothetical protein [Nitrospira sp.]